VRISGGVVCYIYDAASAEEVVYSNIMERIIRFGESERIEVKSALPVLRYKHNICLNWFRKTKKGLKMIVVLT
jgi:hypothetical protein